MSLIKIFFIFYCGKEWVGTIFLMSKVYIFTKIIIFVG